MILFKSFSVVHFAQMFTGSIFPFWRVQLYTLYQTLHFIEENYLSSITFGLFIMVVVLARIRAQKLLRSHLKGEPIGIGGWLIFIFLSLIFAVRSYFGEIVQIATLFEPNRWIEIVHPQGIIYHPWYGKLMIAYFFFMCLQLICIIVLLVAMGLKLWIFRPLMIAFLSANLVVGIIGASIDYGVLIDIPFFYEKVQGHFFDDYIFEIIGMILSSAIWIPYMLRSKRVRNTFIY